ncbi:MAG: hypothetical protein IBX40_11190 [Methanosarcinales archaeon]|nr:hypothetical protein [Methanosarcinales archaeon]
MILIEPTDHIYFTGFFSYSAGILFQEGKRWIYQRHEKYDTSNEHCYHSECHAKDRAIIVMLDKILHNL